MAHADKPQWSDFYENDPQLGPLLPLTSGQRVQLISGVLPSGESSFFDNRQLHSQRQETIGFKGSGINAPFPYPNQSTKNEFKFTTNLDPSGASDSGEDSQFSEMFSDEWWAASGIIKTYPADVVGYTSGNPAMNAQESGIFHWNSDVNPEIAQPTPERTIIGWVVPEGEERPIRFYTQDESLKGSKFSNGEEAKRLAREDFNIFNNYIHHQHMPDNATPGETLNIPFLSSYRKSIDLDVYKQG
tara:strand:+ start:7518 stop:8249 length:732 start_codon:yes stop_codon:yes gene_type:complete